MEDAALKTLNRQTSSARIRGGKMWESPDKFGNEKSEDKSLKILGARSGNSWQEAEASAASHMPQNATTLGIHHSRQVPPGKHP